MGNPRVADSGNRPKSGFTAFQKVVFFLAGTVFVAVGALLMLPVAKKDIDRVEMVYGITIAEAPSSVLNRGIVVIDRDENRIKCQMPSGTEVEHGAPMKCTDHSGNPILIKARRPVWNENINITP